MHVFKRLTVGWKAFIWFSLFLTASHYAAGQGCNCPGINSCGTCVGGLTSLTLQFNGSDPTLIVVTDQLGIVFNKTVNPGATFSFVGSVINEKFAGPDIDVFIDGVLNTTLPSTCSGFAIGKVSGMFTVRAAQSKSGGAVCCSSSIVDKVLPVIQGCPTNKSVDLPANACVIPVEWIEPTATDNCALESMTTTHLPSINFPVGETTVKYIAKDIYGNGSNCTFTVTVNDVTVPVITGCPSDIFAAATSSCNAEVTWNEPLASDNCSAVMVSGSEPGSIFPIGTTVVTYTATDPSGNKSTCTFNVTVENADKPTITGCPDNITVNADDNGVAVVNWVEPSASAVCGEVTTTKTHLPATTFPVGMSDVRYDFTDDFGNVSTCTFTVNVLESNVLFLVSQIVTPDGDGVNDRWELTNIEKYDENTVVIVDRWGSKIFQQSGYDNVNVFWDGTNTSGTIVPTGTYFYSIEIRTRGAVIKKTGFLELIQ
jgi:gliding motility-associated-like protein